MNSRHALIVDDNQMNRELLRFLLEAAGFGVREAGDADEALRELSEDPLPDIVLMDVQLPGTDGLDLTRRMRNDARLAPLKILAVTASAMKGDEQRALAAGCDGYVSKPIDVATFIPQVMSVIGDP